MTRKMVDIWACDVCDKEYRFPIAARECENEHIATLEVMRMERDRADRICQGCTADHPTPAWAKANHRWHELDRLIPRTEIVIANRGGSPCPTL